MARRLRLKRTLSQDVDRGAFGAFRLTVTVTEVENMHSAIFLFLRSPVNPYTDEQLDTFMSVASPVDLEAWPVGEPDAAKPFPIFRTNSVELDLRSAQQAEDTWLKIVELATNLIEASTSLGNIISEEEIWIGDPADAGDSSSESASASY